MTNQGGDEKPHLCMTLNGEITMRVAAVPVGCGNTKPGISSTLHYSS
jgi:hypothetical protein